MQALQAQVQELEKQLEYVRTCQIIPADPTNASLQRLEVLQAKRDKLIRENRVLRELRDVFLKWEFSLGRQVDNHLATSEPVQTVIKQTELAAVARPLPFFGQRRTRGRHWDLTLKQPLTVEECYDMAQTMYKEIKLFNESDHFISSGSSVLGWTDKRRVENGLLKFSLQKEFPHRSAYELMMRTWSVVSVPETNEKLFSESMNMRLELVQQVDASNVLLYQQYEARMVDPQTGEECVTIVQTLLLNTIFETEDGYITLFYSMDPRRVAGWPDVVGPAPQGVRVHLESEPSFTWTSYERVGPTGEHCRVSYVGGVAAQTLSRAYWAVEVLLLVLRWEGFVVGPTFTLSNQDDEASDGC